MTHPSRVKKRTLSYQNASPGTLDGVVEENQPKRQRRSKQRPSDSAQPSQYSSPAAPRTPENVPPAYHHDAASGDEYGHNISDEDEEIIQPRRRGRSSASAKTLIEDSDEDEEIIQPRRRGKSSASAKTLIEDSDESDGIQFGVQRSWSGSDASTAERVRRAVKAATTNFDPNYFAVPRDGDSYTPVQGSSSLEAHNSPPKTKEEQELARTTRNWMLREKMGLDAAHNESEEEVELESENRSEGSFLGSMADNLQQLLDDDDMPDNLELEMYFEDPDSSEEEWNAEIELPTRFMPETTDRRFPEITIEELRTLRQSFSGANANEYNEQQEAMKLINSPRSFGWASAGKPPNWDIETMTWDCFLDYTCVNSETRKALSRGSNVAIRASVDVCYWKSWRTPFSSYRAHEVDYLMTHRTFLLGTEGETQIFIVMEPQTNEGRKLYDEKSTVAYGMKNSAMEPLPATQLCLYLNHVIMGTKNLSRRGVTAKWTLGQVHSASFDQKDWCLFMQEIMHRWDELARSCPLPMWTTHQPKFFAYSIGGDHRFEVSECADGTIAGNLQSNYDAACIETVHLAIAINMFIRNTETELVSPTLWNSMSVEREYDSCSHSNLRIFQKGFSPTVCSWNASKPPPSYVNLVLTKINRVLSEENDFWEDIVEGRRTQGYSLDKGYARNTPHALKLGTGETTALLCSSSPLPTIYEKKRAGFEPRVRKCEAFKCFTRGLQLAQENDMLGSRFEVVLSINMKALNSSNRNWQYVVTKILKPASFWPRKFGRKFTQDLLLTFEPHIYPGVYFEMSWVLEKCIRGLFRLWKESGNIFGLTAGEATAIIERLGAFMYTGNTTKLPLAAWRHIRVWDSIVTYGWPYIPPDVINLMRLPRHGVSETWRRDEHGHLILSQIPAVTHHFKPAAGRQRYQELQRLVLGPSMTVISAKHRLIEIIRTTYIPEMGGLVLKGLKEQHGVLCASAAKEIEALKRDQEPEDIVREMEDQSRRGMREREDALKRFSNLILPLVIYDPEVKPIVFKKSNMMPLINIFYMRDALESWEDQSTPKRFPKSDIDIMARRDLATSIFEWTVQNDKETTAVAISNPKTTDTGSSASDSNPNPVPSIQVKRRSVALDHMSWPVEILTLCKGSSVLTKNDWIEALDISLDDLEIIPGPWKSRVSGRRFIKLTSARPPPDEEEISAGEMTTQVILEMDRAKKQLANGPSLPYVVPLDEDMMPEIFYTGYQMLCQQYSSETKRVGGDLHSAYGAFFDHVMHMFDWYCPRQQVFLHAAAALSFLRPLPQPTSWDEGEDLKTCLQLTTKQNSSPDMFAVCFLMQGIMIMHGQRLQSISGIARLSNVRKSILEHRHVSWRLLEVLGIIQRKSGCRRQYPRESDFMQQPKSWFEQRLKEIHTAVAISSRRYLRIWMSDELATNALQTILA